MDTSSPCCEFRSSDWQLKTSVPCRDGHVAVQLNPRVTTLRTKCGVSFASRHFCSMPAPTPHRNPTATHTHTHTQRHPRTRTSWRVLSQHMNRSQQLSRRRHIRLHPGDQASACRFTARYCGFYGSISYCFFTSFHLDMSLSSVCSPPHSLCSLNSILAASASKLSSQSSQNDCNLDLCFISFPLRKPTLLPLLKGPFSQLLSTGSGDVSPMQRPRWPVSSCWVRVKKAWALVSKAWAVLEAWISAESETVTSTGQRKPSRLLHAVAQ